MWCSTQIFLVHVCPLTYLGEGGGGFGGGGLRKLDGSTAAGVTTRKSAALQTFRLTHHQRPVLQQAAASSSHKLPCQAHLGLGGLGDGGLQCNGEGAAACRCKLVAHARGQPGRAACTVGSMSF